MIKNANIDTVACRILWTVKKISFLFSKAYLTLSNLDEIFTTYTVFHVLSHDKI